MILDGDIEVTLGGKQIAAVFILIVLSRTGIVGQTIHCSHAAAEKAAMEAGRLQTWDKLHQSYLRYHGCDDASIATSYGISIARLLTHRWGTLPQAFPLFASDAGYYAFVLRHIDAVLDIEELEEIRANAIHSCPTGGNDYCVQIRKTAEKALYDMRPQS